VDGAGNAYITGSTTSTEATFPVLGGPDLTYNDGTGTGDAFVAEVSADGTALVYAGYIGGSSDDEGRGIAVDGAGNAYVTGSTTSTAATFPVTAGPDLTDNGTGDAFVAKILTSFTSLAAAIVPLSRSVAVGAPATAFAVVINGGNTLATDVGMALETSVPGPFTYWPIDLSVNPPVFIATPVNVPVGGLQYFFFAIWPAVSMPTTEVQFNFAGTNTPPAPTISGLNTLLLSATLLSATTPAPPDVFVSVATCPSDDGVPLTVNIPGSTGVAGFVAPMINIGAAGQVTVSANTAPAPGAPTLPVQFFLCQTDAVGNCVKPLGGYSSGPVTMTIGSGEETSFNILAQGTGGSIDFNPAVNRVFLIVTEGSTTSGPNRGLSSAGIRTHSPTCAP
jgi:hypothetical protein